MVNTKKLELIEELKELRIQKGMTYQQIADKTEENGEAVSLSTIKLVFSQNNQHDHDFNKILRPIANALSPQSENDSLETKTLTTELELKDEIIEQLKNRIDAKESKFAEREQFYIKTIEFLQEQISSRDEQIKHHNEAMDRKDNTIKELYSIIIGIKKTGEVFI